MINVPFSSLTDEWERHFALWLLNLLHLDIPKRDKRNFWGDVFVAFWETIFVPFLSAAECVSFCLCLPRSVSPSVCLPLFN